MRVLRDTGLNPAHLEIEVTESMVMHDVEVTIETLQSLRAMGVRIAVDDFGTGHSSLAYLQKLPIDVIKIDRSFVKDLSENANDAALATAIIGMAHALGYQVNLPFSKQHGDFYLHWNGGFTSFPGVEVEGSGEETTLVTPHVSGSLIWRARPMVHPMLEAVFRSEDSPEGRASLFTLSPGVRAGKNFADHQMVMGVALPVTFDADGSRAAVLLYFSYELPFKR